MIKLRVAGENLEVLGYFEDGVAITRIDKIRHLRQPTSCILSGKYSIEFPSPMPRIKDWDAFEAEYRARLEVLKRHFCFATLRGFCMALGLKHNSIAHLFKNESDRISVRLPGLLERRIKYIDLSVIPELILLGLKRKNTKDVAERRKIYRAIMALVDICPGLLLPNKKILADVLDKKIRLGIPRSWRLGKCAKRTGVLEFSRPRGVIPALPWMRQMIKYGAPLITPIIPESYSTFHHAKISDFTL